MALKKDSFSALFKSKIQQEVFVPLKESHKDLSLQIAVLKGAQQYKFIFGKDYKFFDLASLTKPIFTMSLCMYIEDQYPGFINEDVRKYIPWFPKAQVKVKDLLSHQSGAPALYPVFENLSHSTLEGLSPLNQMLRTVDFNSEKPLYSDVGFFILGAVLEEKFNRPLINIFQDFQDGKMQSALTQWNKMHFCLTGGVRQKSDYAPTEMCVLRKKKIQGEVHDESCWKMGGVSTHAGLFGGLEDVLSWVKVLNEVFKSHKHYSKKTIAEFYKPQTGDWRLGLMKPSRPRSTAGEFFSDKSYGHLGFTGTSIWVDPAQDLSVVVLSNRTYPDRRINVLNQFRPHIHNIIVQTLKERR